MLPSCGKIWSFDDIIINICLRKHALRDATKIETSYNIEIVVYIERERERPTERQKGREA
jgi:hypothetical protein